MTRISTDVSSGRLLKEICYALRLPEEITDFYGNKRTIIDAFPYNPESKTSPTTAKNWAKRTNFVWNPETRFYDQLDPHEPIIVRRANNPFELTILHLDVRAECGRAYKVVDDENRRFDLREDQIMDVIKHVGIQPGGKIPGTFVCGSYNQRSGWCWSMVICTNK